MSLKANGLQNQKKNLNNFCAAWKQEVRWQLSEQETSDRDSMFHIPIPDWDKKAGLSGHSPGSDKS